MSASGGKQTSNDFANARPADAFERFGSGSWRFLGAKNCEYDKRKCRECGYCTHRLVLPPFDSEMRPIRWRCRRSPRLYLIVDRDVPENRHKSDNHGTEATCEQQVESASLTPREEARESRE